MATHIARRLVFLVTLITIATSERCKFSVPFSPQLVGRRFFRSDGCYRPTGGAEVRVNAKSFLYMPFRITRYNLPFCDEEYIVHFTSDRQQPFVVHFPKLDFPGGYNSTYKQVTKFCARKRPKIRKKYFPVGETRKGFKEAVRTMIPGITAIRDFGCTENDEGYFREVEGRAFTNVDLDGIISYLLGVAYQYNFCAESE